LPGRAPSHANRLPAFSLEESFLGPLQSGHMSTTAPQKRLILGLLWTAFFVAYLDRTNIAVAGPTMMKALDMSPQTFGYVLASFTAGYALMQIPGGMFADRFGAKRMLIIALLIWSLFTGLTGLAVSVGMLIAVRFFFGVGEGLENGAHFKAIGDTFTSHERSAASGIFHTALALGPAFVAPIAALTIASAGWQTLFLLFTIPGVLVAALIWGLFPAVTGNPDTDRAEDAGDGSATFGSMIARPLAWLPFAAYLLFNVAFWGLLNWMPSYLSAERHIDLKSLGYIASIPYLCGFCGLLILGYLGKGLLYRYRPLLLGASYLLAGLGLFLAFTADNVVSSVAGLSFGAFFLYGGFGPFWAVALDVVPGKLRGTFSGFVNFGGQIGGFFSPIVVGSIVQNTKSYSGGFVFMIGALILAGATMVAIQQGQRLPQPATV
jgi:sugar phosphate permease